MNGRDYQRAGRVSSLAERSVLLQRNSSGAEVFGPTGSLPPTVIEVRTSTGLTSYSLMGGP